MAYNLEQLGPTGFQDLAATLVMPSFGPGVQVMGSGRDGGRDLYHRGPLIWRNSDGAAGEVWDGYTVFQAKHKERLAPLQQDNATWLWRQVRAELGRWADPKSGRDPVPDNLLIITNVPLTPVPNAGGHDQLNNAIQKYIDDLADESRDVQDGGERKERLARIRRLRKWRYWDANQINTLLHADPAIRHAFPGFLTAADVFANLAEFTDHLPVDQLEPGLRFHARSTLVGEGSIYFDEAGSGDSRGIPVHEVAVDLPVTVDGGLRRSSVVKYVLDRGEHILKPSLTMHKGPRILLSQAHRATARPRSLSSSYRSTGPRWLPVRPISARITSA